MTLATWWVQATPGTTYWRCEIPARHLPGQALRLKNTDLRMGPDGEVLVPRQEGQTSIWQFVGNATRALIMAHLQEQEHRVLMEVDDNYLVAPPQIPGAKSSWQRKLDRSPSDRYSYEAHARIVTWVDGLIVSTETLADVYSRVTDVPIFVCPNSADPDDWDIVTKGRPAIGYAGSDSHMYDAALVERALRWASDQVDVWKIGLATWNPSFEHKIMPWADELADYRRNLGVLTVGLCPLKRSRWHDCKSDVKAIEYTLAGALPIVQADAPPYADWVDVVPSATTEKDWLKAVKWAVQHPDEVTEAWQRAYDFVREHKLIQHHIDRWREACGESTSEAPSTSSMPAMSRS